MCIRDSGVRGANGVILVTTRRGEKGKAKIALSSSVGVQTPTYILHNADSYTYATLFREREINDGRDPDRYFTDYDLERFRLGDEPIMYPNVDWRDYMMKKEMCIRDSLYAYGLHKADESLCNRATHFLETLKAENNYVTRLWSGAGLPVYTAADSQALLQLQKEYCDKKDCLRCRFGYEYLKKRW